MLAIDALESVFTSLPSANVSRLSSAVPPDMLAAIGAGPAATSTSSVQDVFDHLTPRAGRLVLQSWTLLLPEKADVAGLVSQDRDTALNEQQQQPPLRELEMPLPGDAPLEFGDDPTKVRCFVSELGLGACVRQLDFALVITGGRPTWPQPPTIASVTGLTAMQLQTVKTALFQHSRFVDPRAPQELRGDPPVAVVPLRSRLLDAQHSAAQRARGAAR